MKFCGFQKTSLVDFPDRIASVLFTPGCNLRCPFCHNWRIVIDPKPPFLNEEAALKILMGRKKYIDSVVITGGEPTIHSELPKFLKRLKEQGFKVKLDTNGLDSGALKECLAYVDYVALDVKTGKEKYAKLGAKDATELSRSIEILKTGNVEYELRTTVVPGFVDDADVVGISELADGAANFALQQFIPDDTLDKDYSTIKPYSPENIQNLAETMKKHAKNVIIRI